ncbi:MAG: tRNA (guanosine(37)-N1)-methyltransferase TrmD [Patescibacteria group bacterium]|jgi:tRNA (guanine37-N1)-methyltransferase
MPLRFDIITLFPELFEPFLKRLPLRKAIEKELIEINLWDLKKYAIDKRGTVDDKPYGGGAGMILMIEPIYKALEAISDKDIVIALSPSGERYNQQMARELSKGSQVTLICGRYEGMDERVMENLTTKVVSIGDYVLSGGEIPAMAIMESITRLLPGVLEKEEASIDESFSEPDIKEYPQYTRPEDFKGMKVPDVLLSGNHKEIEEWRKNKRERTH